MNVRRRHHLLGLHTTVALAVLAALLVVPRQAQAATVDVTVGDNYFDPAELTINVGDTVRWTYFGGSTHNVYAVDGSWDSPDFAPGVPQSRTFDAPGEWRYVCKYHAGSQKGTITIVDPNAQPEPTTQPTAQPTAQPTTQPTSEPTSEPTGQPTSAPSPTTRPEPSPTTSQAPTTGSPSPGDGPGEQEAAPDATADDGGGADPTSRSEESPADGDDEAADAPITAGRTTGDPAASSGSGGGIPKLLAVLLLATSVVGLARVRRR